MLELSFFHTYSFSISNFIPQFLHSYILPFFLFPHAEGWHAERDGVSSSYWILW